jgi:ubiquinone/menaquinone biosynthesis C-methylase UbiE
MANIDPTGNASTIEAWNTVLYDKFRRYEHLLIEGLGQHGTRLFECYPPKSGARVMDVGCGMGDTAIQIAQMVGPEGEVVGIDCAENFIEASRERAREHGVDNVSFVCADIQSDDLQGPYDDAYARFGTMFFDAPVHALRNIRRSLKPGGTLHMSVWRKRQDNPCFYVAQQVVDQYIKPEDKDESMVTCGPGPFSMAGPDMVSDQLHGAGFTEPTFRRFDAPMCIGKNIDAGESLRLAADKAGGLAAQIETELREALAPYLRDDGVWAISSTWLVTARVPE